MTGRHLTAAFCIRSVAPLWWAAVTHAPDRGVCVLLGRCFDLSNPHEGFGDALELSLDVFRLLLVTQTQMVSLSLGRDLVLVMAWMMPTPVLGSSTWALYFFLLPAALLLQFSVCFFLFLFLSLLGGRYMALPVHGEGGPLRRFPPVPQQTRDWPA